MYLQDVESLWELQWDSQRSYGESGFRLKRPVHLQLRSLQPGALFKLFEIYEAEAKDLCEQGLAAPAWIGCSSAATPSTCWRPAG